MQYFRILRLGQCESRRASTYLSTYYLYVSHVNIPKMATKTYLEPLSRIKRFIVKHSLPSFWYYHTVKVYLHATRYTHVSEFKYQKCLLNSRWFMTVIFWSGFWIWGVIFHARTSRYLPPTCILCTIPALYRWGRHRRRSQFFSVK